jgi:hypothetical protein
VEAVEVIGYVAAGCTTHRARSVILVHVSCVSPQLQAHQKRCAFNEETVRAAVAPIVALLEDLTPLLGESGRLARLKRGYIAPTEAAH